MSPEKDLPEKWSPDPKAADNNLVWKAPYGSRSAPVILSGRVYLVNGVGEGVNEQERVMCLDANTGKLLWEHRFNIFHTDIVSDRVGWTNPVGDAETGYVYVHGVQGLLFCFDKDGKVVWSRSLTEEYGRISGYGGRVTSPMIDEDRLVLGLVNASWGEQARGGNRFLALDKRTGAVVWWGDSRGQVKDTYYSGLTPAVINGTRLLISGGADGGVHAFKARTGEKVWSYTFGAGAVNCSPAVDGSMVYIAHGDENLDSNEQGRVICLDASQITNGQPKLVWKVDGIKVKFCSPILHGGRLYVVDEIAKIFCLDPKTGKRIWNFTYGRNAMGSPVFADGKIYVGEVNSRFHILKPGDKKCERLHQQFFRSKDGVTDTELNGTPAVANGRIYFATSTDFYCIGKKNHKSDAVETATAVADVAPEGAKPAYLQILPGEVVLTPGATTTFKARLFDANGHFLRETKAEWSLAAMKTPPPLPNAKPAPPGPTPPPLAGKIAEDGTLTVAPAPPAQFGRVVARAEGIEGDARVRVVGTLPYAPNFANIPEGRTPGGWVNTQGKFAIKEVNGKKVLAKTAVIPSPLVARANAFFGMPELADYTVSADLMGTRKGADLPDMGLVASRYTLMLDGNKQKLRLISWDALPRVDKTINYPWKEGVWYSMKLTVEYQGDKGIARGKIWPKGQPEPAAWTVEFEDPIPNRNGSPALYGNATGITETEPGTEIYYDNVKVTPNKK